MVSVPLPLAAEGDASGGKGLKSAKEGRRGVEGHASPTQQGFTPGGFPSGRPCRIDGIALSGSCKPGAGIKPGRRPSLGDFETERQFGALAQAARNYLITGGRPEKAVLDRLAAEALGAERIWLACLDCGALVDEGRPCGSCGLGRRA